MKNLSAYLNARAYLTLIPIVLFVLSGCASYGNSIVELISKSIKPEPGGNSALLSPAYRYLRVSIKGRSIFVTLGDQDDHPDGPIEVYYSTGREVIRLQNGRIVGTVGLLSEWRNVSVRDMPGWRTAVSASSPIAGERIRDVMPGYRFGVRDKLILSKIPSPGKTQLVDIHADSLTWFEERFENAVAKSYARLFTQSDTTIEYLPPARYAVAFAGDRETVVYGEQCLAPDLCFTWQRWSPKKP